MFRRISLAAAAVAILVPAIHAQTYSNSIVGVYTVTQDTGGDVPLASKHFQWPYLPYQADTGNGSRGTQQGYNICNSTTQNQQSMCETGYINSIEDFCIWGSPSGNEQVANVEGEMVAFCTTPKYGTRLLIAGSLQGILVIRTKSYIEVIGYLDQTAIGLLANDTGGEEDPHGADQRGNPLGSLLYSSAFNGSAKYTQVTEWDYFVGSGIFCFKACDPAASNAAELCQHTYDRIGCTYNSPANYNSINGSFVSCKGDDQTPVGQYVSNGVTTTWTQPAESLGPITTIPYTPSIPATSECTTYTSSALYTALLSVSTSSAAATSASTSGAKTSSSRSGSASVASATGSGSASASSGSTSGAGAESAGRGIGFTVLVAAGLSLGMALMA